MRRAATGVQIIGIEDLAANALIELLEKSGCRRVDFETFVKYGNAVTNVLRENGEEATLLFSKELLIN